MMTIMTNERMRSHQTAVTAAATAAVEQHRQYVLPALLKPHRVEEQDRK